MHACIHIHTYVHISHHVSINLVNLINLIYEFKSNQHFYHHICTHEHVYVSVRKHDPGGDDGVLNGGRKEGLLVAFSARISELRSLHGSPRSGGVDEDFHRWGSP